MTNYDFLYDKDFYGDSLFKEHFSEKTLSFRIFDNAIICPIVIYNIQYVCVVNADGNYVTNSCMYNDEAEDYVKNELDLKNLSINDSEAIFCGSFLDVWGHFLTDDLRRIWFMKSKYYEDFKNCEHIYNNFTAKKNYKEFFNILGINFQKFQSITEPVRFKRIIIPDECFITELEDKQDFRLKFMFTSEYVNLINIVRSYAQNNMTTLSCRRYYFSYSKYKSGKSVGENHLEKYFKNKGFEIIYPEKISLAEQLNILANCDVFASTVGSCSHNIMFLKDNSEVILIPRANYTTPYQLAIDKIHPLKISYVDSTFSILTANNNPPEGPFLFFVSKNLKRFFKDEDIQSEIYPEDYKRYFRYAMGINFGRRFGFDSGGGSAKTHKYYSGETASDYYGGLLKARFPLMRKISSFARSFVKKYLLKYFAK